MGNGRSSIYEDLKSICAIHITPFDSETKAIDWESLDANIRFLLDSGVRAIVTGGNTGEFYSLTIEETKAVTKRVAELAADSCTVIAGVGYSVETAIELGRYAQETGAHAVMIHQPIHPYVKHDGLVHYYEAIVSALDIPSLLYFRDEQMSDEVVNRIAPMKNLIGVKYAVNDLARFAELVLTVPKEHGLVWICGTAEKWAPFFFAAGAEGFTSGLVNVYPQASFQLLEALKEKREADVWTVWKKLVPFENLRAKYNNGNNVVVIKEALEMLGFRAGIVREPADRLDERDREEVRRILKSWNLL